MIPDFLDKDKMFLGYNYGVGSVIAKYPNGKPGNYFINGETNSVWVWNEIANLWIDTNRLDSGLKGYVDDPTTFSPVVAMGVKATYLAVVSAPDCDNDTTASPTTVTFTYFKSGGVPLTITVRKTSVVMLFWNGDYWENLIADLSIDLSKYALVENLDILTEGVERLEVEVAAQDIELVAQKSTLTKKVSQLDIEEDVVSLVTDSNGNVAVEWSESNGLNATKLSSSLVTQIKEEIGETDILKEIDEDVVSLVTDSNGNVAVEWSESEGLNATKLSDTLINQIQTSSILKDIDEDVVALVTDSEGNVAVEWSESEGLNATKLSSSLLSTVTSNTKDMEEWRNLGFGLFIHWGVYSALEGIYNTYDVANDTSGVGAEWILRSANVPDATYKAYQSQFTSTNFNPEEICFNAHLAGMKYVVITAKHHEGFCLFDCEYADWDITTSGASSTVLDDLKTACDKYGLKFGIYFSQNYDWLADGGFGHAYKYEDGNDPFTYEEHKAYVENQIKIINYAVERFKPYTLWYDIPSGITGYEDLAQLYKDNETKMYSDVVVNDRLSDYTTGDYSTGEGSYYYGDAEYTENCYTSNKTWGYASSRDNSTSFITPQVFIYRYILESIARGSNVLLNLGPKKDGSIPTLFTSLMTDVNTYIGTHGSFDGTERATYGWNPNWGRMVIKGNTIRCYVMNDATSITIQGIKTELIKSITNVTAGAAATYTIETPYSSIGYKQVEITDLTKITDNDGYPVVVDIECFPAPMVLDYPRIDVYDKLTAFSFDFADGDLLVLQDVETGNASIGGMRSGKLKTKFGIQDGPPSVTPKAEWSSYSGTFTLYCTLTNLTTGTVTEFEIDSATKTANTTISWINSAVYELEIEKVSDSEGSWVNIEAINWGY